MNIDIYNLASNAYLAPDAVIAQIARDYAQALSTGQTVRGEYLRILVAHTRQTIPATTERTPDRVAAVLAAVHDRLYAIILGAITTPDIVSDPLQTADEQRRRSLERNRRSTFARTAKSTLMAFVRSGGDVMKLQPGEVTKEQLRSLTAASAPPKSTEQGEEAGPPTALQTKLAAFVKELAGRNREAAIDYIDALHLSLLQIVATPLASKQIKRGELTLTPAH